jgi:hypothetical protein
MPEALTRYSGLDDRDEETDARQDEWTKEAVVVPGGPDDGCCTGGDTGTGAAVERGG